MKSQKKKDAVCIVTQGDIRKGVIKQFNNFWPGSLEVFLILLFLADGEGFCEAPVSQISEMSGFSRWKVQECLKGLEEGDKIIKELKGIRGHTQIYKVTGKLS